MISYIHIQSYDQLYTYTTFYVDWNFKSQSTVALHIKWIFVHGKPPFMGIIYVIHKEGKIVWFEVLIAMYQDTVSLNVMLYCYRLYDS